KPLRAACSLVEEGADHLRMPVPPHASHGRLGLAPAALAKGHESLVFPESIMKGLAPNRPAICRRSTSLLPEEHLAAVLAPWIGDPCSHSAEVNGNRVSSMA